MRACAWAWNAHAQMCICVCPEPWVCMRVWVLVCASFKHKHARLYMEPRMRACSSRHSICAVRLDCAQQLDDDCTDCAQHSGHVWRRLCSALGSRLAQIVLSTRITFGTGCAQHSDDNCTEWAQHLDQVWRRLISALESHLCRLCSALRSRLAQVALGSRLAQVVLSTQIARGAQIVVIIDCAREQAQSF